MASFQTATEYITESFQTAILNKDLCARFYPLPLREDARMDGRDWNKRAAGGLNDDVVIRES
jgi:hypothetical protein